ncbi:hypothetical protein EDEG_01037 [Edhazardia aedis USNM 41457]|uniref:Uncharacterized protein n=1 Tax=Edhazardia aedis (strain USNM 41457) TaxID=1003232 RepID=J9DTX3_EDHAE|nr:hypothetical protein EDEG_01037 [Edhazardia aedis USNM 41457]|eukprot:EJW04747.1 hypothetical protein EDEG_01037 [Edhazardia aedis USNM 41457]
MMHYYHFDNYELFKNVRSDLNMIYIEFSKNPNVNTLKSIPHKFNLIQVSNIQHRKKKEFLYNFFQSVLREMLCRVSENDVAFSLFAVIIHYIFIYQKDFFVQIVINVIDLEYINERFKIIMSKKIPELVEIGKFACKCFDELKSYGAFVVVYDCNSVSLDDDKYNDVLKEIISCENESAEIQNIIQYNEYQNKSKEKSKKYVLFLFFKLIIKSLFSIHPKSYIIFLYKIIH